MAGPRARLRRRAPALATLVALFAGALSLTPAAPPASAAAATIRATTPPVGAGYWMVGGDGGVFAFGDAGFYGSTGRLQLQRPVMGMAVTADHRGYWLVASDGGIFTFGDARFHGSVPGRGIGPAEAGRPHSLSAPIVGMVATKDGGGYFLVGTDGGVFAFGDARYEGSCPALPGGVCPGDVVLSVLPDASGMGYWAVTATGQVTAFGDAADYGGLTGRQRFPVANAATTPDGGGYVILQITGALHGFGDAVVPVTTRRVARGDLAAALAMLSDSALWTFTGLGRVVPAGGAPYAGEMWPRRLRASIVAGAAA